jgi:hypothetical protein
LKKRTIRAKKIIRSLKKYKNDIDSHFDIDKLFLNKCLYFQIEDYYGYNQNKLASGELKQKTIEVLLNIFQDWQSELLKQNIDFYLAIWLYLPRISQSEVVCGIKEEIDYYKNEAFLSGDQKIKFNPLNFGKVSEKLKDLNWDLKIDLDNVCDWEINFPKQNYDKLKEYNSDQKRFKRNIENSIKKIEKPNEVMYLFPVGDVWVGQSTKISNK